MPPFSRQGSDATYGAHAPAPAPAPAPALARDAADFDEESVTPVAVTKSKSSKKKKRSKASPLREVDSGPQHAEEQPPRKKVKLKLATRG